MRVGLLPAPVFSICSVVALSPLRIFFRTMFELGRDRGEQYSQSGQGNKTAECGYAWGQQSDSYFQVGQGISMTMGQTVNDKFLPYHGHYQGQIMMIILSLIFFAQGSNLDTVAGHKLIPIPKEVKLGKKMKTGVSNSLTLFLNGVRAIQGTSCLAQTMAIMTMRTTTVTTTTATMRPMKIQQNHHFLEYLITAEINFPPSPKNVDTVAF